MRRDEEKKEFVSVCNVALGTHRSPHVHVEGVVLVQSEASRPMTLTDVPNSDYIIMTSSIPDTNMYNIGYVT